MTSQTLSFVDAHHHLWIPEKSDPDLGYGWLRDIGAMKPFGDPTPIQRNYEWQEFASESQHNMVGSVYLQCDGAVTDPVAETAWVQSVFDKTGLAHAIIGLVDLSSPAALTTLEGHLRYSCFKGVRQIVSRLDDNPDLCFAPVHYLRDARWRDQFQLLGERSLSFDLQLYPEQMHEAAEFLSGFAHIPVIIDHAGSAYDQSAKGLARLEEGLKALSALDHVTIKLCGFGMFDAQRNSVTTKPVIDIVMEQFGSERVMFGSNFPVDKLMGGYDDLINIVADNLACLSDAQKYAIFQGNATRVYGL